MARAVYFLESLVETLWLRQRDLLDQWDAWMDERMDGVDGFLYDMNAS